MDRTCAAVREILQCHLDGETLNAQQQDTLGSHLATCASCRSFAHDLEKIMGIVEHLPIEQAPHMFADQVMQHIPLPQNRYTVLVGNLGRLWAPFTAIAGLLIVIDHALAQQGVSLLNLHRAVAEWAGLIDLNNVASLFQATSLFAWSVGEELLVGVSLLIIAIFAMMAQVLASPPSLNVQIRH